MWNFKRAPILLISQQNDDLPQGTIDSISSTPVYEHHLCLSLHIELQSMWSNMHILRECAMSLQVCVSSIPIKNNFKIHHTYLSAENV